MAMQSKTKLLVIAAAVTSTVLGSFNAVHADTNCAALPPGPDRTDCYLVLSRLYRNKAELAAIEARVKADEAAYRSITGTWPRAKERRAVARKNHR
jgi:hypothetical protein